MCLQKLVKDNCTEAILCKALSWTRSCSLLKLAGGTIHESSNFLTQNLRRGHMGLHNLLNLFA